MTARRHPNRRLVALACSAALVVLCFAATLWVARSVPGAASIAQSNGERLFDLRRVWTIHLRFTADQWKAMEPAAGFGGRGGPGGFGPPPGAPEGGPPDMPGGDFPGAPPGFGPPGMRDGDEAGGPPGFGRQGGAGPASFIAQAWMRQGDGNDDGELSRKEFAALAERVFEQCDVNRTGRLDAAAVSAGIGALGMRGGPGERGGPGGPGGRGGPAGRGGPNFVQGAGGRNGMAAAAGVNFQWVHADLEFDGQAFRDVAVRYKGNNTYMSSQGMLKRPLKVDLNRFAPGRRLAGVGTLNLHNNVNDVSGMNEPLSYRLFRDAGVPAPRTSYARVYLTVPGLYERKYVGLYSIVENEDNDFALNRFGTKKGAIFKPVTSAPFEDMGDDWSAYEATYDPKTPLSVEETSRVIAFAKLVSHATDAEFDARVEEFLDLDEFARFMAVTTWLSNMDSLLSMGQNYVVYLHPKTRQFQFIPWDLDHSFGQFMGGPEQSTRLDILKPWSGDIALLRRVFGLARFKRLYLSRMREFSRTIFTAGRIRQQVDELSPVLRPAVKEESEEMLARFDRSVAGKDAAAPDFAGGGDPGMRGGFGMRGGPGMGGGTIKTFVDGREAEVLAQLDGRASSSSTAMGRGGFPGGGQGPEQMIATALFSALDRDRDGGVTRAEWQAGFSRWFDLWDVNVTDTLTVDLLADGIGRDLVPAGLRGGFPGPPGFGGPGLRRQ
jgi:spore coat protein H